jgi:hypothetical protein
MDSGKICLGFNRTELRALQILAERGPSTKLEIALAMPASTRTIHRALNELHSRRTVFVKEYRSNEHGHATRVFAVGSNADAPMPAAKSGTQRSREALRRMTAEERDFMRARNRALARKPRRDPLVRALFGPAPTPKTLEA